MENFDEIVKRHLYFRRVYPSEELNYRKALIAPKNFFEKLRIKVNNILVEFKPIIGKEEKKKMEKYLSKRYIETISRRYENEWSECYLFKSTFKYHFNVSCDPVIKIQLEEIFYATNDWFDDYMLFPGIKIVVKIPGEIFL
jgi:hypothetical protein